MNISSEVGIIQLSILYIKNNDIDQLTKSLDVMPLEKVKNPEILLELFLSVSAGYNRPKIAKIILNRWNVIYPEDQQIPMLSRLFLINRINLPTLSFIVSSHKMFTYVELINDLTNFDSSPSIITACRKADKIFGQQSYHTYKILVDNATKVENDKVVDHMTYNMEKVAPYAPVATWVKNYLKEDLMTESALYNWVDQYMKIEPMKIPSENEIVELLLQGLADQGISVLEEEKSRKFLQQLPMEKKLELIKPVMEAKKSEKIHDDVLLFRTYGPSNPLIDQDLTGDNINNKYGGCRMFLCNVFDYDEEFDYVEDWFTGACQECHLRIKYRWHSVRVPRPHGGWVGSYCSWKCARESLVRPDLLTRELINIYDKQFNEIGIQDRLPDPE